MKKLVAVLFVVLATSVFATTAVGSGPVFEDSGFLCGVIDRDGSGILTNDSTIVEYASGKVVLRCNAQGTPGSSVVTFNNFLCGLGPYGLTTDSTNRVGRNGHIQLVCTGSSSENSAAASSYGAG